MVCIECNAVFNNVIRCDLKNKASNQQQKENIWIDTVHTLSQTVTRYESASAFSCLTIDFMHFVCFTLLCPSFTISPIHNLAHCYLGVFFFIMCCILFYLHLWVALFILHFLDQLSAGFITTYSTRLWCMLCPYTHTCLKYTFHPLLLLWWFFHLFFSNSNWKWFTVACNNSNSKWLA